MTHAIQRSGRQFTGPLTAIAVAVALLGWAFADSAIAQTTLTGPSVSLDRYEFAPGDRVTFTVNGFVANSVTISICGNDARRGSADCNVEASEARRVEPNGVPTVGAMPVAAPPVPCPCVIRVSDAMQQQVAIARVVLIGHPVGPVVGSPAQTNPITISLSAVAAPDGLGGVLTSSLGGAATYDVTVTVRNRSDNPVDAVRVSGSAGRNPDEELLALGFTNPGALEAGQTWTETISADVPAAVFGEVEWRAAAFGAGPSVEATDSTRTVPWLLWLLGAIFVVDVLILVVRMVMRLRRRDGSDQGSDGDPFAVDPGSDDDLYERGYLEAGPVGADPRRDEQLVS